MCIFGTSNQRVNQTQTQRQTFRDAPPVVTGSQIGVDNPKDTKRITEELKIKRQKREGTFVDPNKNTVEESLSPSPTRSKKSRAKFARDSTGKIRKTYSRDTNIRSRLRKRTGSL